MPEISENALMMSIQAIHQIIVAYSDQRDAAAPEDQADFDEIIESYEISAMELREVYNRIQSEESDLPPYADLIG